MFNSNKHEQEMNGIAGFFAVIIFAMTAVIVYSMPHIIRGCVALGKLIGRSVGKLFAKTQKQ